MSDTPSPVVVIPLLTEEWKQDPEATAKKFRQFIEYHKYLNNKMVVCLYRSALVQLMRGQGTECLHGFNMTDEQLEKACGV
jgi:hypothetical protein